MGLKEYIIKQLINGAAFGILITMLAYSMGIAEPVNLLITGVFSACVWYAISYSMMRDLLMGSEDSEEVETPSAKVLTKKYFYHEYVNDCCIVQEITFYDTNPQTTTVKFNFVNKEGNLVSEKWYNAVVDFTPGENGVGIIYDGEMFNFIGRDGNIKSTQWFYGMSEFKNGVAKVRWKDGTINFVAEDGHLIWKEWKEEIEIEEEAND